MAINHSAYSPYEPQSRFPFTVSDEFIGKTRMGKLPCQSGICPFGTATDARVHDPHQCLFAMEITNHIWRTTKRPILSILVKVLKHRTRIVIQYLNARMPTVKVYRTSKEMQHVLAVFDKTRKWGHLKAGTYFLEPLTAGTTAKAKAAARKRRELDPASAMDTHATGRKTGGKVKDPRAKAFAADIRKRKALLAIA